MSKFFNAVALSAGLLTCVSVWAGGPDYDAIADSLVNQSLEVRPGETIQITGNPSQIELMGALQVAVAKAGGQPVILLNLPEANKRALMETPMEHLERLPTAQISLMRMFDGIINVASVQDPDLFADVPEDRLAATRRSGQPLNDAFRNARFRSVALGQTGGIPTAAYAASVGADHQEMTDAFWKAVAVSPEKIEQAATLVTGMLVPGRDVHVKTKNGTDLRFRLSNHPARINSGRTATNAAKAGPSQVWLPAGEAYAVVEAGSARGTLVVDKTMFRGVPLENLRMTFKNGRVTDMSADKNGDKLKEYFATTTADTVELSIIDIGLNPQSQPIGDNYRSWEMGGMTSLSVGNNAWAGGDNNADGTFSMHLAGATVEIGGKEVASNGELSKAVTAAYRR